MLPALVRNFQRLDERIQLILAGSVVGACGGLAAVGLNYALHAAAGWLEPLRGRPYAVLFPAIGALLAVLFLRHIAQDWGGHGVPEVIYAVSRRGGRLRLRSSVSRLVSCLLTIASGGSAGPEAPVVISGSSLGSAIGRVLGLRDRQRVVVVGCGAAAAIGAIFNAPIAGVAFTMEAIMGEWSRVNLIPIATASVVGTQVSRALAGNQIPFEHRSFSITGVDLAACVPLALMTALVAVALARLLRLSEGGFSRLRMPAELRAALGGLAVGLLGLFRPESLGEGYEPVRMAIDNRLAVGLGLVALMLVAKIAATSLTLGSGGSGGLFAPILLVGSLTGLVFQRTLMLLVPGLEWADGGYFALLGMAGVLSSMLQAPMTGVFLIVEITGSYAMLLPVVLVAVLSASTGHFFERESVYHRELIERRALLRPRTDARVLAELTLWEVLERNCRTIRPEMTLGELWPVVADSSRDYFPVVDKQSGELVGMVHLNDLRPYMFGRGIYDHLLVEEIMQRHPPAVEILDSVADVMDRMDDNGLWSLPVVEDGRFLGLVSKATLLDHYRQELRAQQ